MDITLTESPEVLLAKCLDALFDSRMVLNNLEWHQDMEVSLENLACLYVSRNSKRYTPHDLAFDWHAMRRMIGRLQREIFGVASLYSKLDEWKEGGFLSPLEYKRLRGIIPCLGIRINSPSPFHTRRVAAFSLWMSTFRPVALKWHASEKDPLAPFFCAGLNFWIASNWLKRCGGKVYLGAGPDYKKRLARILHDFTYRELSLSSMEFFYSGIFRKDGVQEVDGPLFTGLSDLDGLDLP